MDDKRNFKTSILLLWSIIYTFIILKTYSRTFGAFFAKML